MASGAVGANKLPKPVDFQMRLLVDQYMENSSRLVMQHRMRLVDTIFSKEARTFDGLMDRWQIDTEMIALSLAGMQDSTVVQLVQRGNALGPPHSIVGSGGGDLSRAFDLVAEASLCADSGFRENQDVFTGFQTEGQPFLPANSFFDVFFTEPMLSPPPQPTPPKRVKIQWTIAGRLSGNSTGRACIGGQAPAGATVKVTILCGASMQMVTTTADAQCRWKACFDISGPGNCSVRAQDNADPTNYDSRAVGTC